LRGSLLKRELNQQLLRLERESRKELERASGSRTAA
jgi:hypothetical protein